MAWSEGTPYVDEVSQGLYAYIQPPGGWQVNNCGFIVGPAGGCVLVDTSSTERRTRSFLAEVDRRSSGPPMALVNTHHHPDHTYGNCLVPEQTPVLGHVRCREKVLKAGLEAMRVITEPDYGDIQLRPPEITFSDRVTLYVDDQPVELQAVGRPAHTDNDVVVWVPERRCLFAGDLAFAGGQPFFLEGSLAGYRATVDFVRAFEPDFLVPGHGPVCRGDEIPTLLDVLAGYADMIAAIAQEAVDEGLTPLEAAQRHRNHEYSHLQEPERLIGNLHRACAELRGDEANARLTVGALWPEMEAFVGGPIHSHA
jgi:cyclase